LGPIVFSGRSGFLTDAPLLLGVVTRTYGLRNSGQALSLIEADSHSWKGEEAVLLAQLLLGLFAGGHQTFIFLATSLLLKGTLGRIVKHLDLKVRGPTLRG